MRRLALVLMAWLIAGCVPAARIPAPPVDIAGRWTGSWSGNGAGLVPREEDVTLDLVQAGARGTGRLIMHGTAAANSVPDPLRDAGMTGVRVVFDVSGNDVRLWHELGSDYFDAELLVLGDRMIGRVLGSDPPVRFSLTRERPRVAVAPAVAPPARAPVVERTPPPVAMTPAPPVEAAPPPPLRRDAPPPAEFRAMATVRTIHFDFDRAEIRPGDAAILDANAEWLRANPDRLVLIEGHCDERGTAEYNLALGERRAVAAKGYLVGRGIADSRLTVTSYGYERPLCTNRAESCWAQNRRAAFLVK